MSGAEPESAFRELEGLSPAAALRRATELVCLWTVEFSPLVEQDDVGPDTSFLELGFDSLQAVDFKDFVERKIGAELDTTLAFQCPTPRALAEYLCSLALGTEPALSQTNTVAAPYGAPNPVAIVGMACRLPGGATTPERFWELLANAVDAIVEVPEERWSLDEFYDEDHQKPGKVATRWGGFLTEPIDSFDAALFGISPVEARELDPQQRLLLEVAWECLEDAGSDPFSLRGTSTGVFVGLRESEYFATQARRDPRRVGAYYGTGNALSTASGRLSYTFGLEGPALSTDTACSSSMLALHLAVQAIRNGECDAALAGGVTLMLDPLTTMGLSQANMQAPDGRCKTFDARADGYVRGEGCGLVLLERLDVARARGHRVLAVIRGSASNQDGASGGLTVPSGPAQEKVIRKALANAGLDPADVSYVEAHGTGTSLGDPIEIQALHAVYGSARAPGEPLHTASVKTNIGHLETASGIASLIKLVLALRHERIPPHLHLETPNPLVDWEKVNVRVAPGGSAWPRSERPRIGGTSSFGFSGSNVHLLVEEAPREQAAAEEAAPTARLRKRELVPLSAFTEGALAGNASRVAEALDASPEPALGDIARCLGTGRAALSHRAALPASSTAELRDMLRRLAAGEEVPGAVRGKAPRRPSRIAFVFTGQGSQVPGMGRALYDCDATFRATLDECAAAMELPLLDVLWGERSAQLSQTEHTQPALFALELALAHTWRAWGIEPAQLLGHSVGEYAAACLAGVMPLADACRMIEARGRLMAELTPPGDMLVCTCTEDEARAALEGLADDVSVAVLNGPRNTVLSGHPDAVAAVAARLAERRVRAQPLDVSRAFHSVLMDPMLDAFRTVAQSVGPLSPPDLPFVSCLDPGAARAALADPEYWVRHVRDPVRFHEGALALAETECDVWLEVGPQPHLVGMARRFLKDDGRTYVPSLRCGKAEEEDVLLAALGELWVRGAEVDWDGVHAGRPRRHVALPHYPFERRRHWYDAPRRATADQGAHPLLGARLLAPDLPAGALRFERRVARDDPSFLGEHLVFDAPVVPGAAYLECALAGARAALGDGPLALANASFLAPLPLGERESRLQTHLAPTEGGALEARVFSLTAPEGGAETDAEWVEHARARAERVTGNADAEPLESVRARCAEPFAVDKFYRAISEAGLDYGPAFAGVRELHLGEGEALARIEAPPAVEGAGECVLHPALSDACFQTSAILLRTRIVDDTYLPVGVDRLTVLGDPGLSGWCHTRVRAAGTDGAAFDDRVATLDLFIYDDAGELTAAAHGLRLAKVTRAALLRGGDAVLEWLHELVWVPAPRQAEPGDSDPGAWVVQGGGALGDALRAELRSRGARVTLDTAELEEPARGAVFLGALHRGERIDWRAEQRALPGATIKLARALLQGPPARLFLVTRGAQPAGLAPAPLDADAATLWGLGATLAVEHPELACTCVDLDPLASEEDAARLADELLGAGAESRVALRGDERRVARIEALAARRRLARPGERPFSLEVGRPGLLESLRLAPLARRTPGPGEVEVEVAASALNFKDALLALGMLPGIEPVLGFECAGTVSAVGEGVTHVAAGDEVIASPVGALRTHAIAPAHAVIRLPRGIDAVRAAGVQTVFLTAVHALRHIAALRSGERVLVHAAAGGVGLAAIQVARAAGAEVVATASRGKWPFLRALGVEEIHDSRATDYGEAARDSIDVVLNSLGEEHVAASLECLRASGRFVEIGKLSGWDAARVAGVRPDVAYSDFDMTQVRDEEPDTYRALLEEVVRDLEAGTTRPLPTRVFPVEEAVEAVEHLSKARHVGKVVLALAPQPVVRADRSYIVTGGLGALGLVTAGRLVAEGARHVVLCGRSAPSGDARAAIGELESAGASVHVASLDVADRDAVAALLREVDARGVPLGGVLHAAGVLDDAAVSNLDEERLLGVLAPKLAGARNLHELTLERGDELDVFALFSSMTALVGNAGQAAYAAANAYLDALAHHRAALGLSGSAQAWGPWAGGGMAADAAESFRARLRARGLGEIDPERGADALVRSLRAGRAHVAVIPVRWSRYLASLPGDPPPLYERLAARRAAAPATTVADWRSTLDPLPPEERRPRLVALLSAELATALGHGDPAAVDPAQDLLELGVDSLISVDLKNRVEAALSATLPATLLFDHPTLEAVADYLLAEVLGDGEEAAEDRLLAEIEGLSEEEVERLLAD